MCLTDAPPMVILFVLIIFALEIFSSHLCYHIVLFFYFFLIFYSNIIFFFLLIHCFFVIVLCFTSRRSQLRFWRVATDPTCRRAACPRSRLAQRRSSKPSSGASSLPRHAPVCRAAPAFPLSCTSSRMQITSYYCIM